MSSVPADRKYSKTHEWFQVSGSRVTMGITQFAADELTDVTFVSLPQPGTAVKAGKPFGEIESVKATSELFSAVEGKVVEVNGELGNTPELVNSDPFGQGWMIRLEVSDLSPLDALMDAGAYDRMISES